MSELSDWESDSCSERSLQDITEVCTGLDTPNTIDGKVLVSRIFNSLAEEKNKKKNTCRLQKNTFSFQKNYLFYT